MGGMGVIVDDLGAIKGVAQVNRPDDRRACRWMVGSRAKDFERAFWPLVVCMHVPNLLYIWAAYTLPGKLALYPVVFFEAFGYGAGFAGYFVFLMQVAQRGEYVTSPLRNRHGPGGTVHHLRDDSGGHRAIGLRLSRASLSRRVSFTIPGTLTLLFIPTGQTAAARVCSCRTLI